MQTTEAPIKPTAPTAPLISTPPITLPDHKQLPDSDGTFVKNFQEHPQIKNVRLLKDKRD